MIITKKNSGKKNLGIIVLIKLISISLTVFSFAAIADENNWTTKQLLHQLSEVNFAKISFVETRHSMFLTTSLVIEGNIEYRSPDYLEKNTLSPILEKIVIDGDSMLVEKIFEGGKENTNIRKNRYSIRSHPALKATVGSIQAVLAGNYGMLNENYEMVIDGLREGWTLELVPKSTEILDQIGKIILSGKDAYILKYVIIQADGDESVMKFNYEILKKGN